MSHTHPWPAAREVADRIESMLAEASRITWPSSRYRHALTAYALEVLDVELWDEQSEVGEECTKDDARVSWAAAHKVGKTTLLAVVCLWAWSTFRRVRVFLFAPKLEHIERVALWKEIRRLYMNSGRCAACRFIEHRNCNHARGIEECEKQKPCPWCSPIGDESLWNDDPTVGLQSEDREREIIAYTARDQDAQGGISGPKVFLIFDEAGGIRQSFFDSQYGNSAGGVTWIMMGNPLHVSGEQYEAHHSQRHTYTHVRNTSAYSSPNVRLGFKRYPGLATREWIELMQEKWGPDSPLFTTRVKGEYVKYEPGQMLRVDEVADSHERWYRADKQRLESPHTFKSRGRIQLGVDVAFTGDDAVIAKRRGTYGYEHKRIHGTDAYALADEVVLFAFEDHDGHERKPIVVYDASGAQGQKFHKAIQEHDRAHELELVPVYSNNPARNKYSFFQRRDEFCAGLAQWVRRGGCLPPDDKLDGEMIATKFKQVSPTDKRQKIPTNDEMRKLINRSPDSRNAWEMAVADVGPSDQLGAPRDPPRAPRRPAGPARGHSDDGAGWDIADRAAMAAYRNS